MIFSSLLINFANSLCGVLGTNRTEITSSVITFLLPEGWISVLVWLGGGGGGDCGSGGVGGGSVCCFL